MKKILFAAIAATMMFASCSKDDNNGATTPAEVENAKISINFRNAQFSRAIDPNDQGMEDDGTDYVALKNYMIFIADDNGVIINRYYNGAGAVEAEFDTKTSAKHIYLVANAGDLTSTTLSSTAAPNIASLRSKAFEARYYANSPISTEAATNVQRLWFYGDGEVGTFVDGATDEDPKIAEATVTMKPIAIKLDVTVKNRMKNYVDQSTDREEGILWLKNVSVLRSAGYTSLFSQVNAAEKTIPGSVNNPDKYLITDHRLPSSAGSTPFYRSGVKNWDGVNGWNITNNADNKLEPALVSDFYDADNNDWDGTEWGETPPTVATDVFKKTFYIYPLADSDIAGNFVILTANADYQSTDEETDPATVEFINKWFSIHFDGSDNKDKPLYNGFQYNITMSLNGDAAAGGGGTDEPDEKVGPGVIEVEIEMPTEWIPIFTIEKTFE